LMLLASGDDAGAFEELVRRYQGRVQAIVVRQMSGDSLADDLTQDVFLRAFRARKNYFPRARFSCWLFKIADNVASNARRSLSRRRQEKTGLSVEERLPLGRGNLAPEERSPLDELEATEMRCMVRRAVGMLTEAARTAVSLTVFEGLSYRKAGEAMEMSPQAVKSTMFRARAALRENLAPYMEEDNFTPQD
jgi:RNA polymerase sigma-70 factor, ECF subfamily